MVLFALFKRLPDRIDREGASDAQRRRVPRPQRRARGKKGAKVWPGALTQHEPARRHRAARGPLEATAARARRRPFCRPRRAEEQLLRRGRARWGRRLCRDPVSWAWARYRRHPARACWPAARRRPGACGLCALAFARMRASPQARARLRRNHGRRHRRAVRPRQRHRGAPSRLRRRGHNRRPGAGPGHLRRRRRHDAQPRRAHEHAARPVDPRADAVPVPDRPAMVARDLLGRAHAPAGLRPHRAVHGLHRAHGRDRHGSRLYGAVRDRARLRDRAERLFLVAYDGRRRGARPYRQAAHAERVGAARRARGGPPGDLHHEPGALHEFRPLHRHREARCGRQGRGARLE